jgi:glycosyltransferase involved in cell wall biosynthesis
MSHLPRVSVGIPVYNGEPFLAQALDSILGQTFGDFEVIISDNASTDRTQDICRMYMAQDTRIRYVRNDVNLGAAKNYNRVFDLSSGEYFKWAAADDLCAPNYLAKCVAILDRQPEVILCYPQTTIIDEHGNVIRPYDDGLDLCSPSVSHRFRRAINRIGECNAVFGVIRSNVLRRTPLIRNYPASDRVLLVELTLYGQFCEVPERLFFRRQHVRASSSNRSLESVQEFFDPKTKGSVFMFAWKHLSQNFASIGRAPLKPSDKVRLSCVVIRLGIGYWHHLVQEPLYALGHIVRRILPA